MYGRNDRTFPIKIAGKSIKTRDNSRRALMIYSMTAFARLEIKKDWGDAVWEIRSG